MALQGIDISNWQKGINLDALAVDFAICKATQGASYVSPDCDRQMQQAMKRGLLVGVYHYVNGSGVDAEAQHFAGSIKDTLARRLSRLTGSRGTTPRGVTPAISIRWLQRSKNLPA